MATLKSDKPDQTIFEYIEEEARKFEKTHKIIRTQWFILEVTPGHNVSDEYDDTWVAEEYHRVSDYFDTEEEAAGYMEELEPDKGKTLRVAKRVLREYTVQQWYNH